MSSIVINLKITQQVLHINKLVADIYCMNSKCK